jgi:hypothetical protein
LNDVSTWISDEYMAYGSPLAFDLKETLFRRRCHLRPAKRGRVRKTIAQLVGNLTSQQMEPMVAAASMKSCSGTKLVEIAGA